MAAPSVLVSPQARLSYLALYSIRRTFTSSTAKNADGHFHRSDFTGQGFTGYYEAGQPTVGPLSDASGPRITPRLLKQHLDQFVVGQERAKKVLSSAVYNHYQRVQELQKREDEREEVAAQQARRDLAGRHPVEDDFPGQQQTSDLYASSFPQAQPRFGTAPLLDTTPLTIEKSNVLLLGPSGVGKTLMAKTLARVLEVPFSMSDCTPFTQAGYIGEDVEVCVQRLLVAANYDIAKAERGIICLDEIDKIATAKVSHGKDVSGEGVQQALLKIIEGTTVQVQAKQERGSNGPVAGGRTGGYPINSPLSGGTTNTTQPNRGDVYNVNTDNVLFICAGAFNGLQRTISDRIARGSIGFGAHVRASQPLAADQNDTNLRSSTINDEIFRKNLPFYAASNDSLSSSSSTSPYKPFDLGDEPTYNMLDLVAPSDLQKYGLIPELIGRIPVTCALSSLSSSALVRVLTEPRNSLLAQYSQLFQLSGVELRFTTAALHEVAKNASGMGTGARGLRTVMERLLAEAMFDVPGTWVKHVLVSEAVAKRQEPPSYYGKGERGRFHAAIADEEDNWSRKKRKDAGDEGTAVNEGVQTFEQYREKAKIAGSG